MRLDGNPRFTPAHPALRRLVVAVEGFGCEPDVRECRPFERANPIATTYDDPPVLRGWNVLMAFRYEIPGVSPFRSARPAMELGRRIDYLRNVGHSEGVAIHVAVTPDAAGFDVEVTFPIWEEARGGGGRRWAMTLADAIDEYEAARHAAFDGPREGYEAMRPIYAAYDAAVERLARALGRLRPGYVRHGNRVYSGGPGFAGSWRVDWCELNDLPADQIAID